MSIVARAANIFYMYLSLSHFIGFIRLTVRLLFFFFVENSNILGFFSQHLLTDIGHCCCCLKVCVCVCIVTLELYFVAV